MENLKELKELYETMVRDSFAIKALGILLENQLQIDPRQLESDDNRILLGQHAYLIADGAMKARGL